jgi:hypothetical protein
MTTTDADYASLANKEDNYFLYPIRKLRFLCSLKRTNGKEVPVVL